MRLLNWIHKIKFIKKSVKLIIENKYERNVILDIHISKFIKLIFLKKWLKTEKSYQTMNSQFNKLS